MEYCKKCLENNCTYHEWFTKLNPRTEKEVLISELNHIIEYNIIDHIINKVFLVESQLIGEYPSIFFSYVDGTINFKINTPTLSKKDGQYIPVTCYNGKDDVLNYQIEIIVNLMRHNPTRLVISRSIFDNTELHSADLINFNDSLHMESIQDYPEIVALVTSRLKEFIKKLEQP